jgi:hypothetical protein
VGPLNKGHRADMVGYEDSKLSPAAKPIIYPQLYPHAEIKKISNSRHYPMQETSIYFVTRLEAFISQVCKKLDWTWTPSSRSSRPNVIEYAWPKCLQSLPHSLDQILFHQPTIATARVQPAEARSLPHRR